MYIKYDVNTLYLVYSSTDCTMYIVDDCMLQIVAYNSVGKYALQCVCVCF